MIQLRSTHLHWINGAADDPTDLCAHSPVEFCVNDVDLVLPEDGDWTVSAAGLYLLRTLDADHTPEHPVGDQLFPCCGFSMWPVDGVTDEVVVVGCPNGRDVWVRHAGAGVCLQRDSGPEIVLPASDWREAVGRFAGAIEAFYAACSPKRLPDDPHERAGYEAFWGEWRRRRLGA